MLFSNKRKHEIAMPIRNSNSSPTVKDLVEYLCENIMQDPRKDLFVLDDSVFVPYDLTLCFEFI
jgi:ubiquitin related modifier 1